MLARKIAPFAVALLTALALGGLPLAGASARADPGSSEQPIMTIDTRPSSPAPEGKRARPGTPGAAGHGAMDPMDTEAQREVVEEDPDYAQELAAAQGVPPDEAVDFASQQPAVGALLHEAHRRFPETFAGSAWAEGGVLELSFTSGGEAAAVELLRTVPIDLPVEVVGAGTSFGDLWELYEQVNQQFDELTAAIGPMTVGIDEQRNAVVFRISNESPVAASLILDNFPSHPIEVEVDKGIATADQVCSSRSACTSPFRGGLKIMNITRDTYNCSSSFSAMSSNSRYVLTAGHCFRGDQTSDRYDHNNRRLGNSSVAVDDESMDAGRIYIPYDSSIFKYDIANLVYLDGTRKAHAISSVYGVGGLPAGTVICKAGFVTNRTCGIVRFTSATAPNGTKYTLYTEGMCVRNGDSGAAVLHFNGAVGSITSGTNIGSTGCSAGGDAWTVHQRYVEEDLNVYTLTS